MEVILLLLVIVVGIHSLNTRAKLMNIAHLIDSAHEIIDQGFREANDRIVELEKSRRKK